MKGQFVWYDLMTTDTEGAWAFYTRVVGWGREKWGESTYEMIVGPHGPLGGIEALSDEAKQMGAPPHWLGYVAVDDVDATAARVRELGGTVYAGPMDIPNVGRFAVIADPDGAVCAAFTSASPDWAPNTEMKPGAIGWHECLAGDLEADWAFYADLFGWVKSDDMDMGELGVYRMFAPAGSEQSIGGIMDKPAMLPMPFWCYYIGVDDLAAGLERVRANGGQVVTDPMQVPGGAWVASCMDPQGAPFALMSDKNG